MCCINIHLVIDPFTLNKYMMVTYCQNKTLYNKIVFWYNFYKFVNILMQIRWLSMQFHVLWFSRLSDIALYTLDNFKTIFSMWNNLLLVLILIFQQFSYTVIYFTGTRQNSVDSLAFETLIPKSIVQRYISLLMEHRRIILCGPSGTGKTYLAQKLAEHLVLR